MSRLFLPKLEAVALRGVHQMPNGALDDVHPAATWHAALLEEPSAAAASALAGWQRVWGYACFQVPVLALRSCCVLGGRGGRGGAGGGAHVGAPPAPRVCAENV